jgi:Transposase and inactivated derivatives
LKLQRPAEYAIGYAALCVGVGCVARGPYPDAWVVLPDHLHAVWTLPPGDDDISTRWRLITSFFVRALSHFEWRSPVRRERRERGIWQRRFWEHAILDDADDAAHRDDVPFNPVKHGYVTASGEWPYSTFRACVARGLYPEVCVDAELHSGCRLLRSAMGRMSSPRTEWARTLSQNLRSAVITGNCSFTASAK